MRAQVISTGADIIRATKDNTVREIRVAASLDGIEAFSLRPGQILRGFGRDPVSITFLPGIDGVRFPQITPFALSRYLCRRTSVLSGNAIPVEQLPAHSLRNLYFTRTVVRLLWAGMVIATAATNPALAAGLLILYPRMGAVAIGRG